MGKKSPDEIDESTDFFKCLYNMRTDIDWIYKFIELLERQSIDKKNNQSRDFAISYVITFLKKYCNNYDDYEFVLAVYGFLKGFEYNQYKIGRRIMMYWEYARKYRTHEFIKDWDRDSVSPSLRQQHKRIIGYLDKKIEEMKSEEIKFKKIKSDDYKLGLIEKTPKKLKFPKLRKIEDITFTPENSNFSQAIPENKTESSQQIPEHEIELEDENPSHKDTGLEFDSTNSSARESDIEQEENEQEDILTYDNHETNETNGSITEDGDMATEPDDGSNIEQTRLQDKAEPKNGETAKITRAIYVLAGVIFVAGFLVACAIWRTGGTNADNTIVASVAPPVALSSIDDIPIDNALLVEMETFSIDEEDKIIPLAPGYSKELPIKDISPPNADISTLEVQSSDENIVWEKDGYLTASDDIPTGESIDVYITITAKKHKEIICVQVVSPRASDDVEGLIGGGDAK